jgi:C4-dicarboxylate transporter DctM subunit
LVMGFSPLVTFVLLFLLLFILGMFVGDPLAYIVIPLFMPVVEALGFSPVWFVIYVALTLVTGSVTPPVCISVFIVQAIVKEVPMSAAFKAIWPFVTCYVATILLIMIFPQIVDFLPNMMK